MTTLTAYYDLAIGPVSFDFVVFAVKAEMVRRRVGAGRLHIVIVPDSNGPGGFRDKSKFYDQHEASWRLWNICIPACRLIGATVTIATDWQQAERLAGDACWPDDWRHQTLANRHHLVGHIIAWHKAGAEVPKLSASRHALRKVAEHFAGREVVTLTKRNTYMPERNSRADAWQAAREHIEARGFTVRVIEDTGAALATGIGQAGVNLDVRMAMYQLAAFNLQANNGAASLCWFSTAPYAMLDAGLPAQDWTGLFVKQGLPIGADWPWATKSQRLVYQDATAENIIGAFEAWASATK